MLMTKSLKMLRQTSSEFQSEQCLEMRNYNYSFNRKFHPILAHGTGVFLWLMLVHPVYSKFSLCDYC